jgi:hypothetical protein
MGGWRVDPLDVINRTGAPAFATDETARITIWNKGAEEGAIARLLTAVPTGCVLNISSEPNESRDSRRVNVSLIVVRPWIECRARMSLSAVESLPYNPSVPPFPT